MALLTRLEMVGRSLGRRYFPRKPEPPLDYDPYDKPERERRAGKLLDEMRKESGRSTLETCQRLLGIIEDSFPTQDLTAEYFSNLDVLLSDLQRLERPGQLVIGLGPGRCGSTSLAATLETVPNSCCTHETPPLIFWDPETEQIEFHLKRFRKLASYFSLVADISHWWLNPLPRVFTEFPDAKAIGLIRDPDECAMSFMRIQGFGRSSFNPWVRGNSFWRAGQWDPTYPSYETPSDAAERPDLAKLALITRYVKEYNAGLVQAAGAEPGRILLVRTEELGRPAVQEGIFEFAKSHGQTSTRKLNVKRVSDGKKNQIKL